MRYVVWLWCLWMVSGCASTTPPPPSGTNLEPTKSIIASNNQTKDISMTQMTSPALIRSTNMVPSTDLPLSPTQPLLPAEAVGAHEAVAFGNDEWNVHISLYVFEHQAQHRDAATLLKAEIPTTGVYSNVGSNGPVLFVGYTPNDGSNGDPIKAKHRLARISTVFAGEE